MDLGNQGATNAGENDTDKEIHRYHYIPRAGAIAMINVRLAQAHPNYNKWTKPTETVELYLSGNLNAKNAPVFCDVHTHVQIDTGATLNSACMPA